MKMLLSMRITVLCDTVGDGTQNTNNKKNRGDVSYLNKMSIHLTPMSQIN